MDISKLEVGQEFKNYKELCGFIGESVKTGAAKIKQLEDWGNHFKWNKNGNKFLITDVKRFSIVSPIKILNEEEFVDRFGSKKQKQQYINNNYKLIAYIKDSILKEASRYCEIEYNRNTKQYEIFEEYKYPVPKKIGTMKKGLYKYIIPLLLLKLKNNHDENNKILISVHGLANTIDMHNINYNLLKDNQRIVCSKEVKEQDLYLSGYNFGFDDYNFIDFYVKAESTIKYYIDNALDMLKNIGVLYHQNIRMIIYSKKKDLDNSIYINENTRSGVINLGESVYLRRATPEEIDLSLRLEQKADEEIYLNIKEEGIQKRYYGKSGEQWRKAYTKLLKEASETLNYNINGFCNFYEIYAGDIKNCNNCLSYFDYKDRKQLITDFNNEFKNMLINNAIIRNDKKSHKYNSNYIKDFTNLAGITIDNDCESAQQIIDDNPIKYTITLNNKKNVVAVDKN